MSETALLGDVAKIVRGIAFPKEAKCLEPRPGHVACLRTTNVQRDVEWDDLWFVPEEHVRRAEQFVRTGDILISTANSYELVGKVAAVSALPMKATLGAFISLIRPHATVHPKFLYHLLAWRKTQARIRDLASTTTNISNVSTKKLAALEFSFPHLDDQRSIVAEIEKQFSRLDQAVASLQRVKAQLKRYKASVLKAAVEGRLVETEAARARREGRGVETGAELAAQGRANAARGTKSDAALPYETGEQLLQRILDARRSQWNGKGKYKEPAAPDTASLPELPEGWVWATVDQLAATDPNAITDGPFGSNLKSEHYLEHGPRVIRLQNIKDGEFADEYAHISADRFELLAKHRIYEGDLVIASLGENPPRACIIPRFVGPAIVKADCIRFKPYPSLAALYLNFALNSQPTRHRTKSLLRGIGRPRLTLGEIRTIALPLPPLAEQHRIVAEVDRRLSIVREVEAEVDANLKRAQALRQAVLARAFAGAPDARYTGA